MPLQLHRFFQGQVEKAIKIIVTGISQKCKEQAHIEYDEIASLKMGLEEVQGYTGKEAP
jgi:hypothetical protein